MPQRHLHNLQKCNNLVVSHRTGSWHDHHLKRDGCENIRQSLGFPLDTLSYFVHPLNGLVRWNLVKLIFTAFDDKLFAVLHSIYNVWIALLESQFPTGSSSNPPKYQCSQNGD